MSQHTVIVRILDKEYQVTCPPGQEAGLHQAAATLDKKMRDIRASGKIVGLERVAVMVALNNTYELLEGGGQGPSKSQNDALKRVNDKVEDALHRLRQLEIN
ncbi:MAG: cell division protein ZapA [Bermanella sp.]|jgi:cell division protein ZapA